MGRSKELPALPLADQAALGAKVARSWAPTPRCAPGDSDQIFARSMRLDFRFLQVAPAGPAFEDWRGHLALCWVDWLVADGAE